VGGMSVTNEEARRSADRRWPTRRSLWRWHFYAGLLCVPFVLWLAVTGTIYLFKPQIDAWIDRPYNHLADTADPLAASRQISAALSAVPGTVFSAYEIPATSQSAARVLLRRGGDLVRVFVHPRTLRILHVVDEDDRFTRMIFHLHGELMLGDRGSMLVELAASWAVVMLVTGICLWWPRGSGVAGTLYPRLRGGRRIFWRDLHAVSGLWVSLFTLFLLVSGLPWAKSWGGFLKQARQLASETRVQQDWSTGSQSERAARLAEGGEHADHAMSALSSTVALDYSPIDSMVAPVLALALDPPVLIEPPTHSKTAWTARSDTQNRPRRVNLVLDDNTGAIVSRTDFSERALIDRLVGYGVAAHEGQLFGWFNQALGVFTTSSLILVSISAVVMWWRRRETGTLGAPSPNATSPLAFGAFVVIAVLGILLPLLGISMLAVLLVEYLILRRSVRVREFLGLAASTSARDMMLQT
jgi:uncharacterized iron-regulated membrane protein